MTRRGYLERQGDHMRMRFVREGFDADNPDVPSNQIVFDSDDIGNLSIYRSGYWESDNLSGSGTVLNSKVITWDPLPYIPLVTMQFRVSISGGAWSGWQHAINWPVNATDTIRMRAYSDGIYMHYRRNSGTTPQRWGVKWQCYRVPM